MNPLSTAPAGRAAPAAEPSVVASSGPYGHLARLAGVAFLPLGFLARVPLAMLTVGALTLATAVTGSYAAGGLAAGAVGIGSAVGAPVMGHLADRLGQRIVLLVAAALHVLAVAGLLVAAGAPADGSVALLVTASGAVGATCPQVSPLARVRWRGLTRGHRRELDAALSYESTADELTFVLGPALVGLLASLVAPWLPLVLVVVLTLATVPAFAVHPTHRAAPRTGRGARATTPPATVREKALVLVPVLGMVAMGTFFGATQNALNAFAGGLGIASAAGLLYAVLGVSSAVAALSVAWWPQRFPPAARWVACAAAMAGLSPLLLLADGVPAMLAVLLLVGFPVGPTMVTVYTVGGDVARPERLGTVMTLLASGVVLGSALGAALAGALAETAGSAGAFAVAAGAAAAMLLISAAAFLLRPRDG